MPYGAKRRKYGGGYGSSIGAPRTRMSKFRKFRRGLARRRGPSKSFCRRVVNCASEKKFFQLDTHIAGEAVIGAAGNPGIKLTSVPQGDTDSSRDGDQLTIRSLEFNWWGTVLNTTQVLEIVRILIVQYLPNDTAAPTLGTILQAPTVANNWVNAAYNHDKRFTFKVLHDTTQLWTCGSAVPLYNNNSIQGVFYNMITTGFMRRKIQYDATVLTGTGNIYAWFLSTFGAQVDVHYLSKLNYTDA